MTSSIRRFLSIMGAVLIVAGASLPTVCFGQSQPDPTACPDCGDTPESYEQCAAASGDQQITEQGVLNQVLKGVRVKFEPDKVIRGCFLRDLLTRGAGTLGTGIVIDGATIKGPIDIRNQTVNLHVELINSKFEDDFNMKRSHFLKGLSFAGSSFARLDAEAAIIDFDFILDNSKFPTCPPFFKSIRVGVDLSLQSAKFAGPVNFTGAVIGNNFLANKGDEPSDTPTEFGGADFEGMKVGLDASLKQARFDCFVTFTNAEFNSLSIEDTMFYGDVNFKSTRIHDFYLGKNPAERFKGKKLTIEDLTFQYMSPEDWNELRAFAEKSNTGAGPTDKDKTTGAELTEKDKSNSALFYASLEELFKRHGHSEDSDKVYIAWKIRERRELHGLAKIWSYISYYFVGYGRQKEWLLVWSTPFIFAGLLAFHKGFMELKDSRDAERSEGRYCRFLYTLELFIPIIKLGYADVWRPRALGSRIYKPFHILIGNLIVPIGLAAWAGIIK